MNEVVVMKKVTRQTLEYRELTEKKRKRLKDFKFKSCEVSLPENFTGLFILIRAAGEYLGKNSFSMSDDFAGADRRPYTGNRARHNVKRRQKIFDNFVKLCESDLKKGNLRSACNRLLSFCLYCRTIESTDFMPQYVALNLSAASISPPAGLALKDVVHYLYIEHEECGTCISRATYMVMDFFEFNEFNADANNKKLRGFLLNLAIALGEHYYITQIIKHSPASCDSSDIERLLLLGIEEKNTEIISTCLSYFEANEKKHRAITTAKDSLQRLERISALKSDLNIDVEGINELSGTDFELVVINAFKELGFKVQETPVTGDYGADIIVTTLDETRIAIQCKRFKSKVNLKAVQEVLGSLGHYNCDYGLVITNNTYLNSAKKLAESNDVELWGGDELLKLLSKDISFSEVSGM